MVHAGPRTRAGKPPRDVTKVELELEAETNRGSAVGRSTAGTVGQLMERYLEHLERVRDLSPQTMRLYRRTVRLYIEPSLATMQVRRLTAENIVDINRRPRSGCSADRVQLTPGLTRLEHAVEWLRNTHTPGRPCATGGSAARLVAGDGFEE
jgi:hypothetical protein